MNDEDLGRREENRFESLHSSLWNANAAKDNDRIQSQNTRTVDSEVPSVAAATYQGHWTETKIYNIKMQRHRLIFADEKTWATPNKT